MTARIKIRQNVIFSEPRKYDTAKYKCFTVYCDIKCDNITFHGEKTYLMVLHILIVIFFFVVFLLFFFFQYFKMQLKLHIKRTRVELKKNSRAAQKLKKQTNIASMLPSDTKHRNCVFLTSL